MRCSEVLTAALLVLGLAGCGAPPAVVRTALHGDLTALKREVGSSRKAGTLDEDSGEQLARAVAGREVLSAQGADAASTIQSLLGCAGSLEDVLDERASHSDSVGAAAVLLLIDAGRRDPVPLVSRYSTSPDGAWRAVAARGTFVSEHAA